MILLLKIIIFVLAFAEIKCKSRRRLLRVGVRPDPPLHPFTNTSSLYISYTNFLRGFINTQGLFNRYAPIPSNLTYAAFMDTAATVGFITDRNELSAFMAHALVSSKGLTQTKENNTSIVDELTRSYFRRGYLGIKGVEEYKEASLELFRDLRLLEAPELVLQNDVINWKVSLWKWNRTLYKRKNHATVGLMRCGVIHKVYTILKREWDPKSKPFNDCKYLIEEQ